jgi:hypothetical protein
MKKQAQEALAILVAALIILGGSLVVVAAWERLENTLRHELVGVEGEE